MMKKNKKYSGSLIEDIRRYLNDEMTAVERHAFERKMESDPFLSDAVEGYDHIDDDEVADDINDLKKRIKSRAGRKSTFVYRVAAAVVIVLVASSVLLIKNFRPSDRQIAENSELTGDKSSERPVADLSESKSGTTVDSATGKGKSKGTELNKPLVGLVDSTENIAIEYEIIPELAEVGKTEDAVELNEIVLAEKAVKVEEIAEKAPAGVTDAEPETSKKVAGAQEVVVRQVGAIEMTRDARPLPGYDEYREYLEEKQVYPSALKHMGKVTVRLELIIRSDGRKGEIRVLESPAKAFADEATRLVREGPDWLPAFKDGKAVRDTVKLELIFF
jgi:hypothetical protein